MVKVDLNDDSMLEINLDRASLNWDYSYAYTLGGGRMRLLYRTALTLTI